MLVEDYCLLHDRALPDRDNKQAQSMLYNEATQFLHAKLLQDLSPPWVAHQFSQALPGDGVLCRYLKPTFMWWPAGDVSCLFGTHLFDMFVQATHRHNLCLAAIIARPLYICTHTKENGSVCGNLAAMSPLMEMRDKMKPFSCKKCNGDRTQSHHLRNVPVLRVLRLYPQVWVETKRVSMNQKPLHVMVSAPANDSVWGIGHQATMSADILARPTPTDMRLFGETSYHYNERDSQNIWMHASHIQDIDDDHD